MAQTVFRCPASMPADLLAAWHDHTLNADQAANVNAHAASCPACQSYLSEYAQDDTALRRAEAPALQERIWRGVRADIAQAPQRRAGLPRNAVLGGLGAALAVTLLFAAVFVFVLDNKGSTRSISVVPTASATATNTVIPTPTVTPLQVSPSQGWVTAMALTIYGLSITFSQNEPLTGYVCGNTGNDSRKQLMIGVTHDGGRIWQGPLTTPVAGLACKIFINPLNSQEVILEGQTCLVGCDGNKPDNYRSRDGGQTWAKLMVPSGDDPDAYIVHPVWSGGNLFVQVQSYNGISKSPYALAESMSGGALVWVNQNGLPAEDINGNNHIACAFAIGATYYVCISPAGDHLLTAIASTNDNGITWSLIVPRSDNPLSPFVAVGGDGKTLFNNIERSTDGGLTWKKLPETQGGYIGSAPDGTIYAEYQNTSEGNSFIKLLPGGQTWSAVASGYFLPYSLSWDASGHPVALWAGKDDNSGYPPPGIAYHAA